MSYKSLWVKDLREISKSQGLKGWSKLKKDDLISFIIDNKEYPTDRATEDARDMSKKTIRELRILARIYDVKIRSRANKNEIIYLLGENYGERRQAHYERQRQHKGLWKDEIQANEERIRWDEEIRDEELARQPPEPAKPKLIKDAIDGRIQKWFVDGNEYKDPQVFLYDIESGVRKTIDGVNGPKKVNTNLECVLEKMEPKTDVGETDTFGARSKTHTITVKLGDTYAEMRDKMLESLAKFQRNGSGWQLKEIIVLNINIAKFDPMEGSGYSDLPAYLKRKKAIINMKNEDEKCFRWAVTRALNPVDKNAERLTKELEEQSEKYNWKGITFPTKVKDIHIWETNNNININLFGFDDEAKKIYTIRIGELKDPHEPSTYSYMTITITVWLRILVS